MPTRKRRSSSRWTSQRSRDMSTFSCCTAPHRERALSFSERAMLLYCLRALKDGEPVYLADAVDVMRSRRQESGLNAFERALIEEKGDQHVQKISMLCWGCGAQLLRRRRGGGHGQARQGSLPDALTVEPTVRHKSTPKRLPAGKGRLYRKKKRNSGVKSVCVKR